MIAVQEELDWDVYRLYGLADEDLTHAGEDLPGLALGERAFEVILARKVAAGEEETAWFSRHGTTPRTNLPAHWPASYRELVERRIALIEADRDIALIERPESKRRWATDPWEEQERRALRTWLLDRLEDPRYWFQDPAARQQPRVWSVSALTDILRADTNLLAVIALYAGRSDYDLVRQLSVLLADEAVPYLAAFRYTEEGLRTRAEWERVWDLQRREDAGEQVVGIPVPPRYRQGDFAKASYWRQRGKLDVPKERFVLYPLAGRDGDPTPVVGWAGWDHLEQAQALAALVVDRSERDAWEADRLLPLLAGIAELEPWVRQWHSAPDPVYGPPSEFLAAFLDDQTRRLGATRGQLAAWRPPARSGGRRERRAATTHQETLR